MLGLWLFVVLMALGATVPHNLLTNSSGARARSLQEPTRRSEPRRPVTGAARQGRRGYVKMPRQRCWSHKDCEGDGGAQDPELFCAACAVVLPHLWRDTTGRKRRHPDLAPCDPAGRRRRGAALAAARGHRPSQASQANAGSYREDDHALRRSQAAPRASIVVRVDERAEECYECERNQRNGHENWLCFSHRSEAGGGGGGSSSSTTRGRVEISPGRRAGPPLRPGGWTGTRAAAAAAERARLDPAEIARVRRRALPVPRIWR